MVVLHQKKNQTNYLDTEMLPWWLTPNSAALCVLWHNVLFLLMELVEILEPTNILNDPVFLLYIRAPWQMRQSPKNAGSTLPADVSPATGTVWKARFISHGGAQILQHWVCISSDLGQNQVHSFGAHSKANLIPLCLGRREGANFLSRDR